jgi:hypothetical protein
VLEDLHWAVTTADGRVLKEHPEYHSIREVGPVTRFWLERGFLPHERKHALEVRLSPGATPILWRTWSVALDGDGRPTLDRIVCGLTRAGSMGRARNLWVLEPEQDVRPARQDEYDLNTIALFEGGI